MTFTQIKIHRAHWTEPNSQGHADVEQSPAKAFRAPSSQEEDGFWASPFFPRTRSRPHWRSLSSRQREDRFTCSHSSGRGCQAQDRRYGAQQQGGSSPALIPETVFHRP
ncbi:hypothetical protein AAFF_G00300510 [Aldrovandia affinis]|uniref:Uncharacterized protein n=1 Tax=Aldrovandia affinis TaxID=143900 RepID=A0AAD7SQU5_9TELE|nr:hypothetical protein AAFF_G00300510 [Aldrovandia affinis]